jgi:hypothetical protein
MEVSVTCRSFNIFFGGFSVDFGNSWREYLNLEHKGISISFGKSQHILIKDYGFIELLLHLVYTAGAKADSA